MKTIYNVNEPIKDPDVKKQVLNIWKIFVIIIPIVVLGGFIYITYITFTADHFQIGPLSVFSKKSVLNQKLTEPTKSTMASSNIDEQYDKSKQRVLDSSEKRILMNKAPKTKSDEIQIMYEDDKETTIYFNEINEYLIKQGFTSIHPTKWPGDGKRLNRPNIIVVGGVTKIFISKSLKW